MTVPNMQDEAIVFADPRAKWQARIEEARTERDDLILELRAEGWTFTRIAEVVGMNVANAQFYYRRARIMRGIIPPPEPTNVHASKLAKLAPKKGLQ